MSRTRLYQYKPGSRSAKAIAEALGIMRIKHHRSAFRPRPDDLIINWGASVMPAVFASSRVLNRPSAVALAANKLSTFKHLHEFAEGMTPDFWTSTDDIPDDAYPIVCRTILNGHSGNGIVIANNPDELVPARLYVRYIKKQQEYRIHVAGGQMIAAQRKARRNDVPDDEVNWQIRNHSNGFIFARQGVTPPEQVREVAESAVAGLGLDFGAVDVVWSERAQRGYVLEVNTAPGVEGSTVNDYGDYFRRLINGDAD